MNSLLYQINTRTFLYELSQMLGYNATLDDVPDEILVDLNAKGFTYLYLLGVWQTGDAGLSIARSNAKLIEEYRWTLTDYTEVDCIGSCFAIREYVVHSDFGDDAAMARLRTRMQKHGLKLILDFVPNHVATDHRWVTEHPEYIVQGTDEQLRLQPQNYFRSHIKRDTNVRGHVADSGEGTQEGRVFAHGRDPYFDGWSDTFQLNYGNPSMQDAMMEVLKKISHQCDGVRCDMAMLVLPEVFERTWGIKAHPFWPRATATVRESMPQFMFMAEVYWDLEWTMIQNGFDYAYDKRIYDRLKYAANRPLQELLNTYDKKYVLPIREHLQADGGYMNHMVHFLENHDEQRAAATFGTQQHKAAAVISFLIPGLKFFHSGQEIGKKVRIPIQLRRGPMENVDTDMQQFYLSLHKQLLKVQQQTHWEKWRLEIAFETRSGNKSCEAIIAFSWGDSEQQRWLIVVNYSPHRAQCYVSHARRYFDLVPWEYVIQSIA